MKKVIKLLFMIALFASFAVTTTSCSKVKSGEVGIKFYLLGGEKGVDTKILTPGRYYIGFNEELFLFPTFTQNYVWTKDDTEGSENDESLTFQTSNGLAANADVGITYHLEPSKVPLIFQKYKRGIEEITDVFLRNNVRDAFVDAASKKDIEYIYGVGKQELVDDVEETVRKEVENIGIIIDKLYLIGEIRLPEQVVQSINAKIKATQTAQRIENEVRQARATAEKEIVGAQADSASVMIKASGQAAANVLLNRSITPNLIKYKKVLIWDGKLPIYTGGPIPMLDVK